MNYVENKVKNFNIFLIAIENNNKFLLDIFFYLVCFYSSHHRYSGKSISLDPKVMMKHIKIQTNKKTTKNLYNNLIILNELLKKYLSKENDFFTITLKNNYKIEIVFLKPFSEMLSGNKTKLFFRDEFNLLIFLEQDNILSKYLMLQYFLSNKIYVKQELLDFLVNGNSKTLQGEYIVYDRIKKHIKKNFTYKKVRDTNSYFKFLLGAEFYLKGIENKGD